MDLCTRGWRTDIWHIDQAEPIMVLLLPQVGDQAEARRLQGRHTKAVTREYAIDCRKHSDANAAGYASIIRYIQDPLDL